jgi:acyl-CoA synthetase (AMP-forming)/AMP-acid ligase II
MRIHEPFEKSLRATPDRVFLHLPAERGERSRMTFAQLAAMVDTLEAELREAGVRPSDRVMVLAENCPEHVALILACSRVGAWACGVNARMAPGEIAEIYVKADPRIVYFTVGGTGTRSAGSWSALCDVRASQVPGLLRSDTRQEATTQAEPGPSEVAAIIFTSGSTGAPKGVMITHEGILHFGRVSMQARQLGPQDRSYACLPMTHIFGLGSVLVASLQAGASLVMRRAFDPDLLLEDLQREGVTQLQGPPALFSRVLARMQERNLASCRAPALRYIYAGAAPLDAGLKQRVEAVFGLPLHHGYGLSEYAGALHVTRLGEPRTDNSAGYVVEGAQLRIVDPRTARDVGADETGEIWIRGIGLTPGYFRDEQANREAFREDGWFATGDLGRLDAGGALFVVGRTKEMIIRSGFNVYPAEVEAALNRFAAVEHSAVVGRSAEDGNEEIVAFVKLRAGEKLDPLALKRHLDALLVPYKRPTTIKVLDELPMSPGGKVLKRKLLDMF